MDSFPRPSFPGGRLLPVLGTFALALAVLAAPLHAQQTGTITGQVVDATNDRPLPGAQVSVAGTGIGVLSGAEGRFTLSNVPAGEVTVRAQLIGYRMATETLTLGAGETATLNFRLPVSALALDEMVVTGVGQATQRRELSTSVSVLGPEAIQAAPVQTLDQLLQGRVAGASVSNVSAQPGTASLINFRGVSSVFAAQTPVIYVDGVRVDNSMATSAWAGEEQTSALSELLTSDIERIEITRGGAASTLYGSDASTGVIQIFTRSGTPGPARITARMEQGFDQPELKYLLDARHIYPQFVFPEHPSFNPDQVQIPGDVMEREFFQIGHTQAYSLNIQGGTADVTYSISGRIDQSDGIQPKNDSETYNLRSRVEAQVTDNLRAHFTGGYTRSNFNRIYSGTAIADPITALEVGDLMFFAGLGTQADNFRPALDIFLMPDITEAVNRFQFSTGFLYQHSEYFTARASGGVDHRNNEQRQFQPIGFTPGDPEGSLNRWNRGFTAVTLDAAGTLSYPVDGDITSRFTVGVQGFRDNTSIVNAFGRGFALPGSKDFDQAATISASESNQQVFTGGIYFDEQIGLWNRLFVNLGVRLDGGTSFGDAVDWEVYPKAGLAYSLGQEDFFQDALGQWVSEFQLRAAYGETGKFPPAFVRDLTFSATSFREESAPRFSNPGNPDLRPEVTQTLELGFETALFQDRVGVDFTWYDARTKDALFDVPRQPATGLGTVLRNVGEIQNTGIEVDVSLLAINRPDLRWHLGTTFQFVDNEVTDMGGAAPFFVVAQQRVEEGHPVGAWYVWTPYDASGDGNLDSSEQRFSGGQPFPDKSGSISTQVTIQDRLTISALADWATGHEVFDYGSVWATFNGIIRREIVDCPPVVSPPDCEPSFTYPIRHDPDTGEPIGRFGQSAARSAFLLDGDWFKLREISARYTLPGDWANRLGADRGTIYGSVRNVAIWSENPLVDPELAGLGGGGLILGGETSITMSPPRAFRFGVELVF